MDPITAKLMSAAGGAADRVYVDDLFSTFLFNGTRNTLQIQNGIDLAGEGGMVWSKVRDSSNNYGTIYDTENGTGPQGGRFFNGPTSSGITSTQNDGLTSFNSDGYTLGGNFFENSNDASYGTEHVSWTFRKAPGFFDVVKYTGNGTSGRTVAHSLGSTPGAVVVKCTSHSDDWWVWHRSVSTGNLSGNNLLKLNSTDGAVSRTYIGTVNSSTFELGTDNAVNGSGKSYVAYIFAHQPNTSYQEVSFAQSYYGFGVSGPSGTGTYRFFYNSSVNTSYADIASVRYTVSGQNKWDELSDAIFAASGERYRVGNLQSSGTLVQAYDANYFSGYAGPTYDDEEVYSVCGSYRGTGASGNEIVLGFEPQWVLIKRTNSSKDWMIFDNMRGIFDGQDDVLLEANNNNAEFTKSLMALTPTGFRFTSSDGDVNGSNDSYVYIAIRRPNKPPTAGTDVFNADYEFATDTSVRGYLGHVADMNIIHAQANSNNSFLRLRLSGGNYIYTSFTDAAVTQTYNFWDNMLGFNRSGETGTANTDKITHVFRRAPGFFDVVFYEGTGSTLNVTHNLGVTPDLIIAKRHDGNSQWLVGRSSDLATGIQLQSDHDEYNFNYNIFGTPTATTFSPHPGSGMNSSGENYFALLFATLSGISKIGSYSGTGNNINVDCGFTAGARYVLIKRTDAVSTGDWYVWDSNQGIVSGNDPYIRLNVGGSYPITGTDYIDPLNAGFTVTSSAPAALNTSGGSYLFFAIA
tara:strand:- start:623 stop:2857 length:2235 start_codon:yes stop_codon:yes gene_type:complete